MVLKLEIAGKTYDEIKIVVKGDYGTTDAPGDGMVTVTDRANITQMVSGLKTADSLSKAEFDISLDGLLTVTDSSRIANYVSGKTTTL